MSGDSSALRGTRVLVLEDDYYLATDLRDALEAAGGIVVGPFASPSDAFGAVADDGPDCALVDLNLGHGMSFELPRELARRSIPFAFVTGYDRAAIPAEFDDVARVEKPIDHYRAVALVARMAADRRG